MFCSHLKNKKGKPLQVSAWAGPLFPTGGQEFLVIWLHVWVCRVGLLCFLVLHVGLLWVFPQHSEEISENRSRVQGLMEAGLSELHWHPGCSLKEVPGMAPLCLHGAILRQVALVACSCGLGWEMQKLCVLSVDIKVQAPIPILFGTSNTMSAQQKIFFRGSCLQFDKPLQTLTQSVVLLPYQLLTFLAFAGFDLTLYSHQQHFEKCVKQLICIVKLGLPASRNSKLLSSLNRLAFSCLIFSYCRFLTQFEWLCLNKGCDLCECA